MNLSQEDQKKIRHEALQFLRSRNTMVISTVSPQGEPQAATVYYIVDDAFNLYFMTSLGSKKCENVTANGKVAFVVGTGPEIVTVQGGGMAMPLDSKEAQVFFEMIKRIALQSPYQWPLLMLAKEKGGFCTFKIKPSWMVWLNLHKEQYPDIASEEFYKII